MSSRAHPPACAGPLRRRLLQSWVGLLASRVGLARRELEPLAERGMAEVTAAEGDSSDEGDSPPSMAVGGIRSRQDVIRVLDDICKFYEQNEPSSPVPFLLLGSAVKGATLADGVLADVTPTLMALTGVEPAEGMSGQSLLTR